MMLFLKPFFCKSSFDFIGFMDLKSGLTDYLKKFAESGKVSCKHKSLHKS